MNDNGIMLLSTVMEVAFFVSVLLAVPVLWANLRGRKARTPKDEDDGTPGSPAKGVSEPHKGE